MATSKTTAKTTAQKAAAPAKATKAPAKTAKAAPAKKAAAAPQKAAAGASRQGKPAIHPEQRRNYVEVAAYYIAERHGFTPGRELQDWAAAEAEIDRLLKAGLLHP